MSFYSFSLWHLPVIKIISVTAVLNLYAAHGNLVTVTLWPFFLNYFFNVNSRVL